MVDRKCFSQTFENNEKNLCRNKWSLRISTSLAFFVSRKFMFEVSDTNVLDMKCLS